MTVSLIGDGIFIVSLAWQVYRPVERTDGPFARRSGHDGAQRGLPAHRAGRERPIRPAPGPAWRRTLFAVSRSAPWELLCLSAGYRALAPHGPRRVLRQRDRVLRARVRRDRARSGATDLLIQANALDQFVRPAAWRLLGPRARQRARRPRPRQGGRGPAGRRDATFGASVGGLPAADARLDPPAATEDEETGRVRTRSERATATSALADLAVGDAPRGRASPTCSSSGRRRSSSRCVVKNAMREWRSSGLGMHPRDGRRRLRSACRGLHGPASELHAPEHHLHLPRLDAARRSRRRRATAWPASPGRPWSRASLFNGSRAPGTIVWHDHEATARPPPAPRPRLEPGLVHLDRVCLPVVASRPTGPVADIIGPRRHAGSAPASSGAGRHVLLPVPARDARRSSGRPLRHACPNPPSPEEPATLVLPHPADTGAEPHVLRHHPDSGTSPDYKSAA